MFQKPSETELWAVLVVTFVTMGRLCVYYNIYVVLTTFSKSGVLPFSKLFVKETLQQTVQNSVFLSWQRKCDKMDPPWEGRESLWAVFFKPRHILGPKVSPWSRRVAPCLVIWGCFGEYVWQKKCAMANFVHCVGAAFRGMGPSAVAEMGADL